MKKKKDFSDAMLRAKTAEAIADPEQDTQEVQEDHEKHDAQEEPTPARGRGRRRPRRFADPEEAEAALMAMQTRGRGGVHLKRINMAFAPDVYQYIKYMSAAGNETMTQFVNRVLRQSMDRNTELYKEARQRKSDFLEKLQ